MPLKSVSRLRTATPQFKRDLLALLLSDNIFCRTVVPKLPEDIFDQIPEYGAIYGELRTFVLKFGNRPRQHELAQIIEEACEDSNVGTVRTQDILKIHSKLWVHTGFTPANVRERVYDAIVIHEMRDVLKGAADLLDSGKYDELLMGMQAARNSAMEEGALTEYWETAQDRVTNRGNKGSAAQLIPTGMGELDMLFGGGVPRGKLAVVMAASGRGKSAILACMSAHTTLQGYVGAYLTYELDDADIMDRVDASLSGIALRELGLRKKPLMRSLVKAAKKAKPAPGPLFVKFSPTKSEGLSGVRAFLERIRTERGTTPDVLYLDYFDLLKMEGSYSAKHEALEENMEMLRGLAGEYNMAIWTACQTNRGGVSKGQVDMEDMASSYGKVFPLDVLIAVGQGEKEKRNDVFRLFVAKSRISKGQETFYIRPEFEKMQMNMLTDTEVQSLGLGGSSTSTGSGFGAQSN